MGNASGDVQAEIDVARGPFRLGRRLRDRRALLKGPPGSANERKRRGVPRLPWCNGHWPDAGAELVMVPLPGASRLLTPVSR